MSNSPSTLGGKGDGRDKASGRFARGWRGGHGNPLAGKAAKIRAELLKASTKADVKEICRKLIDGAKAGDLHFIREWFDRTSGKPSDFATEERIAAIEAALNAEKRKD